jgi:transcriptional regulator with XRE-family HTH domain
MDRQCEALAEFLKQKREEAGIQQKDQAALLGIEAPELTRYIKGKRKVSEKFLNKILEVYGKNTKALKAIYSTRVSQEEIGRAETAIQCGAEKKSPLDLVVWIKYGV